VSEPAPSLALPDQRRLGPVRLAGLLAALIAALLLEFGGGAGLRERLFDVYQQLRPRQIEAPRAHVVWIDAESLKEVGQWPWPRFVMAELTQRIADRGATAIGFDMLFPERDRMNPDIFAGYYPELSNGAGGEVRRLPSPDVEFGEVIGRNPVVLGRAGVTDAQVDASKTIYADPAKLPVEAEFSAPLTPDVLTFRRAVASIAEIEEVGLGHGLLNGPPDEDGVVRRVPLVGTVAGRPTPGFALELARVSQGLDMISPVVDKGRLKAVRVGDRTIPTARDGRFRLHFGDLPDEAITSAVQVLRRDFAPDAFKGQVVLLGLAGEGTSDIVTTPLAAQTYGVLVQAQAVDAILKGEWLERPVWAGTAEWLGGAGLVLVAILLFPRLRGLWAFAVPAALAVSVLAASWLAFAERGLLLDPLRPRLIGGAAAAAVLVALSFEGARIQRRLRVALEEERRAADRAAGELAAARDIQRGMLPPRESLSRLDRHLDIDAVLEPARTVGGDFYDAVDLGGGRIGFLIGDVTGKGVPAALFMALSKALSKSMLLRQGDDLETAVTALDEELSRDNSEDMFVTMLIGIFDDASGRLTMVNAGHENPLLVRADGSVSELAMDGGPPLCAACGFPYAAETIMLEPGDGLVVVTDGVTEAQDPAGGFFERHRAIGLLSLMPGDWRARAATDSIVSAVRAFEAGGEPSDDLTVLALRRRI
jgi:serine phosphatase RsbU (regulator of sigma subunit)/CHASE2 domain-containing sensor protein